jgi:hypothetical protein
MKNLRHLFFAAVLSSCMLLTPAQAGNHINENTGLLQGITCRMYNNNGLSTAFIQGTSEVDLRANFGYIELSGVGWTFDTDTIYPIHFDPSGMLTVHGTYQNNLYAFDFIQSVLGQSQQLCLVAVNGIPELATSSLLLGVAALVVTTTRRK